MTSVTARKVDRTGRSTGKFANSKFAKANRPPKGEPFIWFTREMLHSPAFRAMSAGALKVMALIAVEHMSHGGGCNGDLPVTYRNFEAYGLRKRSILDFLAEASVLGFIARTYEGVTAWGQFEGAPAKYRLTWLPTSDGRSATNEWKRFRTAEEAEEAVRSARSEIEQQRQARLPERRARIEARKAKDEDGLDVARSVA